MRVLLGIGGLLVVLAVVGWLGKKQMASIHSIQVPQAGASATGSVQQQSQQIQQQFKAAAEAAVQQARPVPDDGK